MTMSLAQRLDAPAQEVAPAVSALVGRPIRFVQGVGGGRNSQIYQIVCDDALRYCAKRYFSHRLDGRKRLDVEWSALRFLWDHGVRNVPRPIASDAQQGIAVYEWIEGDAVRSETVSEADVEDTVELLSRLKALRGADGSQDLSEASEACLSGKAAVGHIERRIARLTALLNDTPPCRALHAFLTQELVPAVQEAVRWAEVRLERSGTPFSVTLDRASQTLSPSDFGFHNALRRADGRLVYLDFEYFGWDDPAKMLADFLLHPGMVLSEELRRRFAAGTFNCFAELHGLPQRTAVMYRLCGLKWCTILLNEFVPEHRERRRFADEGVELADNLLAAQLGKARRMLERVMTAERWFPYGS